MPAIIITYNPIYSYLFSIDKYSHTCFGLASLILTEININYHLFPTGDGHTIGVLFFKLINYFFYGDFD